MPNDFEDFMQRFWDLQSVAKEYGFHTLVCIHDIDSLRKDSGVATQFAGGRTVALGMAMQAQHHLLNDDSEDPDA